MEGAGRRALGLTLVMALLMSVVGLAASQTFINKTGKTVTGIKIEFSKGVRITRHDSAFPDQSPTVRSDEFTFSGKDLRNFGRFTVSWMPSSAKITNYNWIGKEATVQKQVASVPGFKKDTFEIGLGHMRDGTEIKAEVKRQIWRHQLPFGVHYEVSLPTQTASYSLYWDLDKYVDSDNDGDPTNDRDMEGASISLTYTENYNPTVTLHVVDKTGTEVAVWENMIRNDFSVGESIHLDGKRFLTKHGIQVSDVSKVSWTQQHMEKMSFEYMTEYKGNIINPTGLNPQLVCKYPGKYVLDMALVKSDGSTEHVPVVAWVVRTFQHTKPVGFMMADLWNEYYDQQDNRMANVSMFFSDYDAIHKLDYLQEQGFQSVDVMNIFAMTNTQPYPEITDAAEGIHHISDHDLAMVFSHIPEGNLDWETYYFGSSPSHWTDFDHLSRSYYEHFFSQYQDNVLQEAALAEKLGLSSFMFGFQHPYLWGLNSIREKSASDASWVRSQWISLCDDVRIVFHGKLGIGVPARDSFTTPITQHVDFIYENLGNFGGHAAEIKWAKSVEDLRTAYSSYLDKYVGSLARLFHVPVRFTFWAYSYDKGSTTGWILDNEQDTYNSWDDKYRWGQYSQDMLEGKTNPKYPPNFREQVKMIEAMMPMLGEKEYIEGIVSEYENWKLESFTSFSPDNVIDYFQLFTGNLQGKPGFQAYKLWASMLDPNDRLEYRHVIPPRKETKIVIGDSQFIADSNIDWATLPYVATVPEGYAPATYWGENGQEDISTSHHWNLPGHDLKGIKYNFDDKGMAIRWETYKPDIAAGFTFELRFHSSADPDASMYIDMNPRDKRADVQLQTGGDNYYLESSIAAFEMEPSQTSLYLEDIELPEQTGWLHDLQRWQVSAFILFPSDSGSEYYELPADGATLSSQVEISAGETITLNNLSFDASIWTDVPVVFEYPSAPDIGFNCDGDQDLTHAQFWGRSGSKVASVKTALTNDALVVRVDLHDGDRVGNYSYIVSYNFPSAGRMLIFLDPQNSVADIALDANSSWTWIGKSSGGCFGFDDRSVYAVVPLTTIADYATHDILCASKVDLHINYVEGSRRELFFFPSPNVPLQCVDRNVLAGTPVEAVGSSIEQIENGVVVPKQVEGIATFKLGSLPHAVIPYKDSLFVVDYVGDIYSFDPASGSYTRYVGVGSPQFVDGAVNGNSLYVSQEDGLVLRFDGLGVPASVTRTTVTDLTTGENKDLTLAGIEVLEDTIYGLLLDETSATYFLCTYDLKSGVLRTKTQVVSSTSLGELITLCSYEGLLYTVDWMNARAYSIVSFDQGKYKLEQAFDLTDYVPRKLWAQEPRGFCWSQWGLVLATTGYSTETSGKIHIVGETPDGK